MDDKKGASANVVHKLSAMLHVLKYKSGAPNRCNKDVASIRSGKNGETDWKSERGAEGDCVINLSVRTAKVDLMEGS